MSECVTDRTEGKGGNVGRVLRVGWDRQGVLDDRGSASISSSPLSISHSRALFACCSCCSTGQIYYYYLIPSAEWLLHLGPLSIAHRPRDLGARLAACGKRQAKGGVVLAGACCSRPPRSVLKAPPGPADPIPPRQPWSLEQDAIAEHVPREATGSSRAFNGDREETKVCASEMARPAQQIVSCSVPTALPVTAPHSAPKMQVLQLRLQSGPHRVTQSDGPLRTAPPLLQRHAGGWQLSLERSTAHPSRFGSPMASVNRNRAEPPKWAGQCDARRQLTFTQSSPRVSSCA